MSQRTVSRRRLFSRAIIVCPSTTSIFATWAKGTGNPSARVDGQPADRLRGRHGRAVELYHDVKPPVPFVKRAHGLTAQRGVDELGHVLDTARCTGRRAAIRQNLELGLWPLLVDAHVLRSRACS